jgi:hypothetical protein
MRIPNLRRLVSSRFPHLDDRLFSKKSWVRRKRGIPGNPGVYTVRTFLRSEKKYRSSHGWAMLYVGFGLGILVTIAVYQFCAVAQKSGFWAWMAQDGWDIAKAFGAGIAIFWTAQIALRRGDATALQATAQENQSRAALQTAKTAIKAAEDKAYEIRNQANQQAQIYFLDCVKTLMDALDIQNDPGRLMAAKGMISCVKHDREFYGDVTRAYFEGYLKNTGVFQSKSETPQLGVQRSATHSERYVLNEFCGMGFDEKTLSFKYFYNIDFRTSNHFDSSAVACRKIMYCEFSGCYLQFDRIALIHSSKFSDTDVVLFPENNIDFDNCHFNNICININTPMLRNFNIEYAFISFTSAIIEGNFGYVGPNTIIDLRGNERSMLAQFQKAAINCAAIVADFEIENPRFAGLYHTRQHPRSPNRPQDFRPPAYEVVYIRHGIDGAQSGIGDKIKNRWASGHANAAS